MIVTSLSVDVNMKDKMSVRASKNEANDITCQILISQSAADSLKARIMKADELSKDDIVFYITSICAFIMENINPNEIMKEFSESTDWVKNGSYPKEVLITGVAHIVRIHRIHSKSERKSHSIFIGGILPFIRLCLFDLYMMIILDRKDCGDPYYLKYADLLEESDFARNSDDASVLKAAVDRILVRRKRNYDSIVCCSDNIVCPSASMPGIISFKIVDYIQKKKEVSKK